MSEGEKIAARRGRRPSAVEGAVENVGAVVYTGEPVNIAAAVETVAAEPVKQVPVYTTDTADNLAGAVVQVVAEKTANDKCGAWCGFYEKRPSPRCSACILR